MDKGGRGGGHGGVGLGKTAAKGRGGSKQAEEAVKRDPRLDRLFDILEAAFQLLNSDADDHSFDAIVEDLFRELGASSATLEGAKRIFEAMLRENPEPLVLDRCLKLAEDRHRQTCVCCRDKASR